MKLSLLAKIMHVLLFCLSVDVHCICTVQCFVLCRYIVYLQFNVSCCVGSKADKGGLEVGDVILAIDYDSVLDKSHSEIVDILLRGACI